MILLHLSIAVFLGFGDIVNTYTLPTLGEKRSYQAVFWLEVACAGASLLILVFFVKIKKAESALTADEIVEMRAEEEEKEAAEKEKDEEVNSAGSKPETAT